MCIRILLLFIGPDVDIYAGTIHLLLEKAEMDNPQGKENGVLREALVNFILPTTSICDMCFSCTIRTIIY